MAEGEAGKAGKASSDQDDVLNERVFGLLDKLDLVGIPEADKTGGAAGVIQSATFEITQQVKKLVIGLGGTTVVLGGAGSAWAALEANRPVAIAVVAGIAVVLATLVFGLAKVVDGDVRGRAAATAGQIAARAAVANQFLELNATKAASGTSKPNTTPTVQDELRVALAGYGNGVEVSTENGSSAVKGLQWSGEKGLRVKLENGDLVDLSEVTSFKTRQPSRRGNRSDSAPPPQAQPAPRSRKAAG